MGKSIFKFFSMRFISVLTIVCLLACSVDMTAFAEVVEGTDATVTSDDVETIPATGIVLETSRVYAIGDEKVSLRASLIPENSTDSITWYSSDTNVVTVSGNLIATISPKGEGQTIITAKTTSGVSATCEVVVSQGDAVTKDFTYEITDGEVTITGYTGTETDVVIPETIDGYEVVSIGERAFLSSSIVNVEIPERVTEIGPSAFGLCRSLSSVELPEGLIKIGKSAFDGCFSLANIELPESVTEIGEWAFGYCKSLTSIKIPDGVTAIEAHTFIACENLMSVEIPDKVVKIGESAFSNCIKMESIKLSEGITEIGNEAFFRCTSLVNINIPQGVSEIGEYAFYYCENLSGIDIPKGVTKIGANTFRGCYALENVNIPDGVTEIGELAFEGCESLTAIDIPESVTIMGESAFSGCDGLTSVNIPGSIKKIENYAFNGCGGLLNVVISEGVTEIGDWTFCGCGDLRTVTLPESVTEIGDSFDNPSRLIFLGHKESYAETYAEEYEAIFADVELNRIPATELIIAEAELGLKLEVGEKVTIQASMLPSDTTNVIIWTSSDTDVVTVSESGVVNAVGRGTAYITARTISGLRVEIGVRVGGTEVTENGITYEISGGVAIVTDYTGTDADVIIPSSIEEYSVVGIDDYAFSYNNTIESVEIPDTVTHIGECAFEQCQNLVKVKLPTKPFTIEWGVFWACTKLTDIEFPDGMTDIGEYTFYDCAGLQNIVLPETLEDIWSGTFGCTGLTKIEIPEGVTQLSYQAFMDCKNLKEIKLPNTVTTIGEEVFWGCTALTDIYFNGSEEQWKNVEIAEDTISDIADVTIHFATSDEVVSPGDAEAIDFTYEINNGEVTITGYTGSDKVIDIPETVSGCDVTAIGVSAFEGCRNVTGIDIPEGVREIGANAFKECYSLVDINIPEGVTEIAAGTFSDCIYLVEIEIPKGVVKIGGGAFQSCNRLKSIVIPEGVTEIGAAVFRGSVHLTDITIPKSVETIGVYAFTGCSQLTIHGYGGSYAETYAKESGIAFHDLSLIPATAVALNSTSLTLKVNETYTLLATMTPVNTTDTVTWTSSATNVATVSDAGVITAVAKGTTVITVTTSGGKVASCTVTVEELEQEPVIIPATTIKLNQSKAVTIYKGKTLTLKATLTPSNSTDSIIWTSSKKNVANVVGDGKKAVVTGLKKGTTTITARTSSGKAVTCKVTVKEVKATKIKLSKTQITINKGKSYTLKATLTPKNTTDTVAWTSSKKSVAKVTGDGNKAVVTGVKKGTATITAKTSSGKKVTCKVTVKEIKSTRIKLNKTKLTLKVGKSATLKATLTPKNSTDTIKWSSSKSKIAKVSENGKVTAVKKGTATITAKTSSGKKVTCKVTVK